jgi:predicted solute-binding protein
MSMDEIRVACVRYLNTAPLIHGLDRLQGLVLLPAVPADIGAMVARGEADIGLASIVDARRFGLRLVPAGMIGCDGPTLTVRIFSRRPLEEIEVLHADIESHTSVELARIVLKARRGREPRIRPFSGMEAWPESVLLIGDKVIVNHPPESEYPYQLDLGGAWKEWTGLPFVYAMWMVRPEFEARRAALDLCTDLLSRQRRHNATRLKWIARTYGARAGWPVEVAERYLMELLRYEVTPAAQASVERFSGLVDGS